MNAVTRQLLALSLSLAAMPAAAAEKHAPFTLIASVQRALASAPGTFSAPTLDEVWANADAWSKRQRAPLLKPQRDVRHADGAELHAGAFTLAKKSEIAFADRAHSPESALGVVLEFEGELAFAGDLPAAESKPAAQARDLGELVHAVVPSQPTRITLVPRAARPEQQIAEVRQALGERYAGVPIAISPEWP